jgi:hypothetical protein
MIKTLYVNGDSHVAGAYLDKMYQPDISFAGLLAKQNNLEYVNEAIAGGSNDRIIRTSKEYLKDADPSSTAVFIVWSTFERTEWFYENEWHQISGQPLYEPNINHGLNKLWKDYTDAFWHDTKEKQSIFYFSRAIETQYKIKEFSDWLTSNGFRHLFCHAHSSFFYKKTGFEIGWNDNIWLFNKPYDNTITFFNKSLSSGHRPDNWSHFGEIAHREYAEYISGEFKKFLSAQFLLATKG